MNLTCSSCKETKQETLFNIESASKTGRQSRCKVCTNKYSKNVYYKNNKSKQIAATKKWKQTNQDQVLAKRYKVSVAEIKQIRQTKQCEICGSTTKLVIDHDHDTGKLRGILCSSHNLLLGRLGDKMSTLQRYIDYLNK